MLLSGRSAYLLLVSISMAGRSGDIFCLLVIALQCNVSFFRFHIPRVVATHEPAILHHTYFHLAAQFPAPAVMIRFSDRLMSTSGPTAEVNLPPTNCALSDEGEGKPSTPEQEYSALVGLIGLHQTIRILEAEYSLVAGDGKQGNSVCDPLFGYLSSLVLLIVANAQNIVR